MGYINTHWPELQASSILAEVFTTKPMLVHKRCKNPSDSLVRANTTYPKPDKVTATTNFNGELTKCPDRAKNCKNCPKPANQAFIKCNVTKQTYKLPPLRGPNPTKSVTCQTKNLIYALECKVCHKQYVGETKRTFKERIAEHLGDIKNQRLNKPLGKHFNLPGHKFGSITTCILELIKDDPALAETTSKRRAREYYWIMRLRTPEPFGLNSMIGSKSIIVHTN
jgi:hypothetical protein